MSVQGAAMRAVKAERRKQDERWGEQNHPYWPPDEDPQGLTSQDLAAGQAAIWKDINALRVDGGTLAWEGILLEEVFEALAEVDNDRRIEELTQVAAVAVAMIEAIRRGGTV